LALADRTFPDQQSLQIAQRLLDNAGHQLQSAIDGCQNVQNAAKQLQQEHTEAAGRVAEALQKAKEPAPDEPGLLDELGDAVGGALGDLTNTLADSVDQAWDFVQDHAELISKLSDVVGDIGNGLGVLSDVLPPPVDQVTGAVATGMGLAALGGHALAKTAGAEVAPETLAFDAMGAATSLAGMVPGVPTWALKLSTYGLPAEQFAGEAVARVTGKSFEGPWGDFESYWIPKDAGQWALTGSAIVAGPAPWAAVALQNATEAGVQADSAPERRRERAEDEVWN
jgi:hypothetical protein